MPLPGHRRSRFWAPALLVLAATYPARAEVLAPAAARLRADVSYLADDEREGRAPGTKGIEAAAEYIAEGFRKAGLRPAPGAEGLFQPFQVTEPRLGEAAKLALEGPESQSLTLRPESEFTSLSLRGTEIHAAPLVFAGYGITAKDEQRKLDYDDYAGLDVKGKAVLVLRGEPQADDDDSPFDGKKNSEFATFVSKARNAEEHGAAALLVVNTRAQLKGHADDVLPDGYAGRLRVPTLMIARDAADRLLKKAGLPALDELETGIDRDLTPRSRALDGWAVEAIAPVEVAPVPTRNVVGVLEGAGPLADETVIVGAHYDHLGKGGMGSLARNSREIHNGADDNASGTAMVLEMARRLAGRPEPPPRRVVFLAFSGEERGLLGSDYYVKHPLFPLASTVAMVNFDMVGRLNDRRELTVYGAGSAPGVDALLEALGRSQGLKINNITGTGGEFDASDHASFYRKDIPVVFLFTGNHPQYHRPTDDTDLINFDGMARIADVSELLLLDLARRPERPEFVKLKGGRRRSVGQVSGGGAYMGTQPSYAEGPDPGVTLGGVTEGSPAEKAGLKADDRIIKFDGKDIKDIYEFMEGLGAHKPGDEVEVGFVRGGKEQSVRVTLGARASDEKRD